MKNPSDASAKSTPATAPRDRDDRSLGEHLKQDPLAREADQPQDANCAPPLLDEHHHQGEQEHRAPDDGDNGNGQMEALEDDEGAGAIVGRRGWPGDGAWQPCGKLASERRGIGRLGERDVDRRDGLERSRIRWIRDERREIRQVHPDLELRLRETQRIGRRLVHAIDSERARAGAGRLAGQPDDVADAETACLHQLTRHEDARDRGRWLPGGHQRRR